MASYEDISRQAEVDLNTDQAKVGSRQQGLAEAGVDSHAEKKFPGAEVLTGDELSTNRGYNKRIPPSEGGILDDRGRQATGQQYEGKGGPIDKLNEAIENRGGDNDNDVVPARIPQTGGLGSARDIATQGQAASVNNVGHNPSGPGGSLYKGENYYTPESVPDSISAEGNIAPESVTQASRETEGL